MFNLMNDKLEKENNNQIMKENTFTDVNIRANRIEEIKKNTLNRLKL